MGRAPRVDLAGYIYHVINRANGRREIFHTDNDYSAFEQIMQEAKDRVNIDIYSYCIMPNHWHLVLSPKQDGDLSKFTGWLTLTHTQRRHAFQHSVGEGHIYQGRYKSFLVSPDEYFLQLVRYVEQNPLRAKLVNKSQQWLSLIHI